jgi:hypothetical protein
MLGFRPLSVGKRKAQAYRQAPNHDGDLEDGDYNEKGYASDDYEAYMSSGTTSPSSSRQSSGAYDPNPNNIESRPLAPNRTHSSKSHRRAPSKPTAGMYTLLWVSCGEYAAVLHVVPLQQQLGLDTERRAGAEQTTATAASMGELSVLKSVPWWYTGVG